MTPTLITELKRPVFATYYLHSWTARDGRDMAKLVHYHTFYECDRAIEFMKSKVLENVVAMFVFEDGQEPLEILWEDLPWKHH
jgi:hypothetical protein